MEQSGARQRTTVGDRAQPLSMAEAPPHPPHSSGVPDSPLACQGPGAALAEAVMGDWDAPPAGLTKPTQTKRQNAQTKEELFIRFGSQSCEMPQEKSLDFSKLF